MNSWIEAWGYARRRFADAEAAFREADRVVRWGDVLLAYFWDANKKKR